MIADVLTDAIQVINNYLDGPMYHRATFGDDNLLSEISEVVAHMDRVRRKLDTAPSSFKRSEAQREH